MPAGGAKQNRKGVDGEYEDEDDLDYMKEDPAVHEGGRRSRPESGGVT